MKPRAAKPAVKQLENLPGAAGAGGVGMASDGGAGRGVSYLGHFHWAEL